MNKFEKWLLKRLAQRLVVQGYGHGANITEYYRVINDAARREFNEDNKPTLDSLLSDCHRDSLVDNRQWKLSEINFD